MDFAHLQCLGRAGASPPRRRGRGIGRHQAPDGGRVPGHLPGPDANTPPAGHGPRQHCRGRRRRPVHLQVPGRQRGQPAPVTGMVSSMPGAQAHDQLQVAQRHRGGVRRVDGHRCRLGPPRQFGPIIPLSQEDRAPTLRMPRRTIPSSFRCRAETPWTRHARWRNCFAS